MPTYPSSPRSAFLEWCQVHEPEWSANAAAIGLTPAAVTAWGLRITAASDADLAQATAKQDLKTATEVVGTAYGTLREDTAELVAAIRAFAENSADPSAVYALAKISPTATPTPVPPPAKPVDLTVELEPGTGLLTIKWKASNPPGAGGTAYIVRRRLPDEVAFSFVGVTGNKRFTDSSLIAGPDWVQYQVQGQRSDQAGPPSDTLVVNFGQAPGDGSFNISSQSSQPLSQAA